MAIILFGLTGGIACGKSTIASFLTARGLPVINADIIAREAVAPESEGLAKIAETFGPTILDRNGNLDRSKLGTIIFANHNARKQLENITHPLIHKLTQATAKTLEAEGHPLAAFEAALIIETGLAESYRPLVVATANTQTQIQRIIARDNLSPDMAVARINSQASVEDKLAFADYTINTDTSLTDMKSRTDDVLRSICVATNVDPRRYGIALS
ncbi:MAG: dephospho-CoA kinase [Polyangiaceae bacterium]|nr:dephospho-CoA kinase [Polyangiaceae bacterium]